jgi:hypothetical protein
MKPYKFLLPLLVTILASCTEDKIIPINGDSVENVSDTTADRSVSIVFSNNADAIVSGTGDNVTATVNGNGVTVTNSGSEKITYYVSGTTGDGYLKIYSGRKQCIVLNNASITNSQGAAINVQGPADTPNKGKRVDLLLQGDNSLTDGVTYSNTPSDEDEKGTLFSEGQIVVSGSGALTVKANGKSGIVSDDWVQFVSGTVNVQSAAGHGVKSNDYILVSGGNLDIRVTADGKKGFTSDSLVRFEGGTTTMTISGNTVVTTDNGTRDTSSTAGVKADQLFEMIDGTLSISNSGRGGKGINCDGPAHFQGGNVTITVTGQNYGSSGGGGGWWGGGNNSNNSVAAKGIKVDGALDISGGIITVTASNHEGIETKSTLTISGGEVYSQSSDDAINAASDMTISGGYVCAHSTGNDGLDANGNLYIKGGVVYAIGKTSPEMAIDANTEGGKKFYLQGGTLIAIGNLENGSQLSQPCYQATSWTKNAWYAITSNEKTYAFKTPSGGGQKLIVSWGSQQPTLTSGISVSNGTERCNAMLNEDPQTSGGSNVNLSTYTSGGGWH